MLTCVPCFQIEDAGSTLKAGASQAISTSKLALNAALNEGKMHVKDAKEHAGHSVAGMGEQGKKVKDNERIKRASSVRDCAHSYHTARAHVPLVVLPGFLRGRVCVRVCEREGGRESGGGRAGEGKGEREREGERKRESVYVRACVPGHPRTKGP